jgi:erythromycin esterase-like protein
MSREALSVIRHSARWFEATPDGFGPLLDSIGDASLVLIGEASHGTHEFYRTRAELTKALITKRGFNVIAVEAGLARRLPGQSLDQACKSRSRCRDGPRGFHAISAVDVAQS